METRKNLLLVLGEWWESRQVNPPAVPQQPRRLGGVLRWFFPNGGTLLLVALLIATQSLWARPAAVPNAPGPSATTVNYQGRLADNAGTPLDGTYGMSFALYDAATGGTLIWGPEAHTAIPVSDGLFSVGLGSQTAGGIPTSAWNGDRYLEITVGGEMLSPRELIRSVPIAGMALTVPDGAITKEKLGDTTLWRGLNDGAVIQSGSVWMPSDQTNITIAFDQAFTSTPLVIITQIEGSAGYANLIAHHLNQNQFQVAKRDGTACGVHWIAIGSITP
ncbi:MAG TPA: hypothetical protein PKH77_00770 [Anaerolineae bacterium]|nr:hypothetical protein [Anaerolineae bacterium]